MGLEIPGAGRDRERDSANAAPRPTAQNDDGALNVSAMPHPNAPSQTTQRSEQFPIGLNISAEIVIADNTATVNLRDGSRILETYPLRNKTVADQEKPVRFRSEMCDISVQYSGPSLEVDVKDRGLKAWVSRYAPGGMNGDASIAIDREIGSSLKVTVTENDGRTSILDSKK